MKDTLTFLVSSIVEHADAVEITESNNDGFIELIISVDSSDIGKVIGKEGKIIRAIRNAMKIPAIKQKVRINVSLAEQPPQPTA